ncbi:MAG TPA: TIGR02466 family protein [Stellaceae bacterium]|nr:TIGR02466 family protein [Stellaceae bacterium]
MAGLGEIEFVNLFPSPFASYQWPDNDALNKELRQKILAHERETPGLGQSKSNVGGWHSEAGQLQFCGDAGSALIGRMIALVTEATARTLAGRQAPAFTWAIEAWANVNRVGDFNRMHIHGMSTWSGTYYVDDGDPPPDQEFGTALEVTDASAQRSATFFPTILSAGIYIKPRSGLMVLFPSYLPHMVMPHRGKRPRISIAFNFRKNPFP